MARVAPRRATTLSLSAKEQPAWRNTVKNVRLIRFARRFNPGVMPKTASRTCPRRWYRRRGSRVSLPHRYASGGTKKINPIIPLLSHRRVSTSSSYAVRRRAEQFGIRDAQIRTEKSTFSSENAHLCRLLNRAIVHVTLLLSRVLFFFFFPHRTRIH